MIKTIALGGLALGLAAAAPAAIDGAPKLYEEVMAHREEARVITNPIAGIENRFWFNYGANVIEARKELTSDLGRASDTEDLRSAWDEYRHELSHERDHYVKEMLERGYRYGTVRVGE